MDPRAKVEELPHVFYPYTRRSLRVNRALFKNLIFKNAGESIFLRIKAQVYYLGN